jgi:hypothetical protein
MENNKHTGSIEEEHDDMIDQYNNLIDMLQRLQEENKDLKVK